MQEVAMARNNKPQGKPPCIAALRINYEGTFGKSEIPSAGARLPLNKVCRAFDGIKAIVQILYANEVERDSQSPDGDVLDTKTVYGLFEALLYITDGADANAVDLGKYLWIQSEGGAK
jgi:hypothetical protein